VNRTAAWTLLALASFFCGCRSERKAEAKPAAMPWQRVATWSGHGNAQTDSFDIGLDECRIRWETTNAKPAGAGSFHVTVNSAVSGRALVDAVDHKGVGRGLAYVSVDPHFSYLVIESADVDWTVSVEEPALSTNQKGQ